MRRIDVFDTTLRDGEQSPGVALSVDEKLQIARQLARLGVNIIEAGFPAASPGDFEAVRRIAQEVQQVSIAGMARAHVRDIETAWEALSGAEDPRIHTFIATSPIHMKYKLGKKPEEVLEQAVQAVRLAKKKAGCVEFSAEDASRSNLEFLTRVFAEVIKAGADVINITDTVGYAVPEEFAAFVKTVMEKTDGIEKVKVSVHCHNDLGLAVANTLGALSSGIHQIEGTVNGIGERAGNASIEELVMALYTRKNHYGIETSIVTQEIARTSQLVSRLTGMIVQPNKAIVGKNAFLHESGIHQDGVLKERSTYEIMSPSIIGLEIESIILGKHSGRNAVRRRVAELGYELDEAGFEEMFTRFKVLAERKREVTTADLLALIDIQDEKVDKVTLDYLQVAGGTQVIPTATAGLLCDGKRLEDAACGDGPVDAVYKAIDKILGIKGKLVNYALRAIDNGEDAQGEASVTVWFAGHLVSGHGVSTDIVEASAKAYLQAVNRAMARGWLELSVEKVS